MAWGLRHITGQELGEWEAYQRLYGPLGPEREDRRTASLLYQTFRLWAKDPDSATLEDFLPQWAKEPAAPQSVEDVLANAQSPEEMRRNLRLVRSTSQIPVGHDGSRQT